MKKNNPLLIIALIFISHTIYSQESQQSKVKQLTQALNNSVALNFQLELKRNKAFVKIDQLSKTLDLRNSNEIAQDSISKKAKTKLGRYIGPIFWKYNFQPVINSNVAFKANKFQQIFCTISFKEQDTIQIKSMLNAFSSVHKNADSFLHTVEWVGNIT